MVALVALSAGCGDDGATPSVTPAPVVMALSEPIVAPGDTLRITGSDFSDRLVDNTVSFHNPLAVAAPFAGNSTTLDVVVPPDAATGPVRVSTLDGGTSTAGPVLHVTHGLGEVWLFGGTGSRTLKLRFDTGTEQYLLIPHATGGPVPQVVAYDLESAGVAGPVATRNSLVASSSPTSDGAWAFKRNLLDSAARMASRHPGSPVPAARANDAAQPETRQFNVLNSSDPAAEIDDPQYYTTVTARLRHNGTHCLIYTDVDTLATGNLTDADIGLLGDTFDTRIYGVNTSAFVPEKDLDVNGKVIIVISLVVNGLSPADSSFTITGFFNPIDLYPQGPIAPAGTTNYGEVLYLLASDPLGERGQVLERQKVADENLITSAHEFEHLISIAHRQFDEGGALQATWLEEGMAHVAEDLNGLDRANISRIKRYLLNPGGVSLEDSQAPIEQRGGIFLMLRWLGDRFGDQIFSDIVQSRCEGRGCIEAVTGENFYRTFADFLATLYLSGKGIAADGIHEIQSLDLTDTAVYGSVTAPVRLLGFPAGGTVARTGGNLVIYTNNMVETGEFTFAAPSSARLRSVVVRIQ